MGTLLRCLISFMYCFILVGCGEQNTTTQRPTVETTEIPAVNNSVLATDNTQIRNALATANQPSSSTALSNLSPEDTGFSLTELASNISGSSQAVGNSVPTVIQSNYENCGPASLSSVLNFHGKRETQSQIAAVVTNGNGSTAQDLIDYARSKGFENSKHITRQGDGDTMSTLQSRVAQRPQIVMVGPQNGGSIIYDYPKALNPDKKWQADFYRKSQNHHFMVVQSFTAEGNPVLMDPARSELGRVVAERSWFERHWKETVDIS